MECGPWARQPDVALADTQNCQKCGRQSVAGWLVLHAELVRRTDGDQRQQMIGCGVGVLGQHQHDCNTRLSQLLRSL